MEEMNLSVKQSRINRESPDKLREARIKYLTDERRIKAVTVCFTDLEGRLHMLDYDKKFLLKSQDNLTFDGSSVRGFSAQHESDLRLNIDWSAFYWLPSDVFGPGKVLVFSEVLGRDGKPYESDLRSILKQYTEQVLAKDSLVCHVAPEIEGFLFNGRDAERRNPSYRVLTSFPWSLHRVRHESSSCAHPGRASGDEP
jgi:glutamine synthetase